MTRTASRSTTATGVHRVRPQEIVTTFGTWCTGVEMPDVLLAEFRHRYNHRVSERRRTGFPKLGHYDTWLIDSLQLIVERNHGVQLFEGWSNTSDFVDTPERCGTVCLHSPELGAAIEAIELELDADSKPPKLTADQKYICEAMGTKLPLLPVHGEAECRLFSQLIGEVLAGEPDFDQMAISWYVPSPAFRVPTASPRRRPSNDTSRPPHPQARPR